MYQQENCDEMFTNLKEIFQIILDQHASVQICDSSLKQNKKVKNHGHPRNSKNFFRRHLYYQNKFSQNYDVFDEFKKCRNLVKQKLRDAHHKYSVDFLSKVKHRSRNGISSIKNYETTNKVLMCLELKQTEPRPLTKKQSAMHLKNFFRKWANILLIWFLSIFISWTTIDSSGNSKSPGPGFVHTWALKAAANRQLVLICNLFFKNVFKTISSQQF